MLTIRLSRQGSKKRPHYRVVVADSVSGRGGHIVESLGTYEPKRAEGPVSLKQDRISYWLSKGAHATDTVRSLIRKDLS